MLEIFPFSFKVGTHIGIYHIKNQYSLMNPEASSVKRQGFPEPLVIHDFGLVNLSKRICKTGKIKPIL